MARTRSKGKGKRDELEMDNDEMFQIIDQTDILNGGASGLNGSAYEIMRPSELDARKTDSSMPATSVPPTSASRVPKLVELIDSEEAEAATTLEEDEEQETIPESPFEDPNFRMLLCLIVFSTLWLCLDMMIHAQYAQETSLREEVGRAVNVIPGLAFVIYFTFWYPRHPLCRAFLLACSTIGGSHMIYLVNHAGFLQVMRRCPVLGTLWIWSIVQLDLMYALGSLLAVGIYTWWNGLKLVFG